MPSHAQTDKARTELQKEVLDILSQQVPSDPALRTSSRTTLLQPGTPAANCSSPSNGKALVLQLSSDLDGTLSAKDDQGPVVLAVLPDRPQQSPEHASSGSITRAWLADVARGGSKEARGPHAALANCKQAARSTARVIRAHPYVAVVSLLTTAAILTAGVVGVLAAASTETRHRMDSCKGFANNAAVAFEVQLQQSFAPLVAMAAMIHVQPYYPALAKQFDAIAAELIAQVPVPGAIASLQLTPQGVVHSMYPLKGNEAAMGHNVLKDPERRGASLATINNGNLTMQGPVMLKQGFRGAVARTAVFIHNVSEDEWFGAPDRPYNCDICYNATTRRKFWGFVSCIVKLADLSSGKDARLTQLTDMGYDYEFSAPQPDTPEVMIIAASPHKPVDPVVAKVEVPNNEWTLLVAPTHGWVPSWRNPMLATVIIISALFGGLVLATLVSRHLQLWLLKETKASNEALAAEKTRMDVLLARQYNLISCMAGQQDMGNSGRGTTLEEKTLDRIESMRREIGVASATSGVDNVSLLELLGEGTFGKVYKGLWRGSTVAVKTMILPARMSGAEKRERMAIMEAAISSTMAHPNIVQTYTYTIKRATTSGVRESSMDDESPGLENSGGEEQLGSNVFGSDGSGTNVHSFEVNLVLEYCDWGCLRDALDAGAFFSGGSLNYAAILDTAADVAKAMLHLHCNQVIHSDLKVRNVLLKSDGSSERGCIAKVADFGLAVKMDHQDTHVSAFQGTMSHMAPEALLRGHISKAADVYSFGITLWELFTGCHAYFGIPRALLGHQVAVVGLRPTFPDFTPYEYRNLAERCWIQEPEKRPTFSEVLGTLTRLRQKLGGHTLPLGRYQPQPSLLAQRERAQIQAAMGDIGTQSAPLSATTSSQEQKKVVAARDTGLMQFESFKASYYLDNSSGAHHPVTGAPQQLSARPAMNAAASIAAAQHRQLLLEQQQQLKQQQQQLQHVPPGPAPDFHHYSEAGAELDALQKAFEEHGTEGEGSQSEVAQPAAAEGSQNGTAAGPNTGSLQAPPAPGPGSSSQLPEAALTPEQQQAQQQVALQLQILEQFAQQQQWMQQQQHWQQWQQQQQQIAHQTQHSPHGSGSYFERRNRPKLETIADQPDAEAAIQQQQQDGKH